MKPRPRVGYVISTPLDRTDCLRRDADVRTIETTLYGVKWLCPCFLSRIHCSGCPKPWHRFANEGLPACSDIGRELLKSWRLSRGRDGPVEPTMEVNREVPAVVEVS